MKLSTLRSGALLLAALLTAGTAIAPAWSAARTAVPKPAAAATTATPATPSPTPDEATAASAAAASAADADTDLQTTKTRHGRRHGNGNDVVSVGRDSNLPEGETADSVVAVLGSASSAGQAGDVVSVFGDTRVTGPVSEDAVAVLGDTYVDSTVDGDAVAVLGNMELGPHANVRGDVVNVGGHLTRDPDAVIGGSVHSVEGFFNGLHGLRAWIKDCLLYGRPLAFEPAVGWAWGVALGFLAFYVCLALLFRGGITRCARTFEAQPGMTALASVISVLFTPILLVLLCITVIGIPAVPFVMFGLFLAGLFGKAVMLAWLGQRCVGGRTAGALGEPAVWVLIGGAIVLVLYLVPVLGFVVYKLLGLVGLGTVIYTLVLAARAWQAARPASSPPPGASTAGGAPPAGTMPSTGTMSATAVPPAAAAAAGAAAEASMPGAAPAPGPTPIAPVPPAVAAALPRAGFWIRMAALLLDALLVGFVMRVLHMYHLELLVLAIYGAVMWKLRGSTIGGIVFDLRVIRLDGRPIDWETAIVRALSCFLSLAVAGLGFFWIAFDHDKQAWHDKIAGTVVVRVARGVSLASV